MLESFSFDSPLQNVVVHDLNKYTCDLTFKIDNKASFCMYMDWEKSFYACVYEYN